MGTTGSTTSASSPSMQQPPSPTSPSSSPGFGYRTIRPVLPGSQPVAVESSMPEPDFDTEPGDIRGPTTSLPVFKPSPPMQKRNISVPSPIAVTPLPSQYSSPVTDQVKPITRERSNSTSGVALSRAFGVAGVTKTDSPGQSTRGLQLAKAIGLPPMESAFEAQPDDLHRERSMVRTHPVAHGHGPKSPPQRRRDSLPSTILPTTSVTPPTSAALASSTATKTYGGYSADRYGGYFPW